MPNTIESTTTITRKMAPNTYAPASLGFAIVFLTVAIVPCFALLGFGIYKLRSWMASRRPVDVEAAISQIQPEVVPVVGHYGFDAQQATPKDDLQRLYKAPTINSSTGAEPVHAASPELLLVVEPLNKSPSDVEVNVFPQNTSAPAPSSSFELWANQLFTIKDESADEDCSLSSSYSLASTIDTDCSSTYSTDTVEQEHELEVDTTKLFALNSPEPGPASSSSFEIWANKLFTTKDEFTDEGCSLSSSYSLASTVDTDTSSTCSTDDIEVEQECEVNVYDLEDEDVDDVLSIDTCVGLVSSPSFMDLSAALDEGNVTALSITITPPTPKIEWEEDNDKEAFESLLVASPSFTALATAFDYEEFDEEAIEEEDDGLDEAMRVMTALTTHELDPITEEQEPEDEGITEHIAEHTPYTTLALLSSSRSVTKRGTPQHNHDKENQSERSPTKHRNSLKALSFVPVSWTPKAIPMCYQVYTPNTIKEERWR